MKGYTSVNAGNMLCPTPVVMVSCGEKDDPDKKNIITVAWVGTINTDPPMLSISIRPERYSHHMILETGEFVVNIPDCHMARITDYCGVKSGRDTDKAADCGITYVPAEGMKYAPAINDVPICISCVLKNRINLGSHDLLMGEIKAVNIRKDLMDENGAIHVERAELICSNHGIYQRLGPVIGFFGYSVARKDVFERRMKQYRKINEYRN